MFRYLAPAGAPVGISRVFHALGGMLFRRELFEGGLRSVADWAGARHVRGTSSGRAALSLILRGLHQLRPERDIVVLHAYTCFSVAASVVHSGLKLHLVDVDPETLDFDFAKLEALSQDNLLCIVTSSLFGLVNDMPRIRRIAQAKGAFVVDDAAQALGATLGGEPAGMLGDVGFYSLGRGKAATAMEGGVIVTNADSIASALEAEGRRLTRTSTLHSSLLILQLLAYTFLLHPRVYWVPNSIPFLKLGCTEFMPDFKEAQLSHLACALLPSLTESLAELNRIRREKAKELAKALEHNSNYLIPRKGELCHPNYVRFPVIATSERVRRSALERMDAVGIGARAFYPSGICDIPGIEQYMDCADYHCPRAEDLARRLFTLPTHPFVSGGDLKRMIAILRDVDAKHEPRQKA